MELLREVPDTARAALFEGEPLVQSFVVAGRGGRVWITTAEALSRGMMKHRPLDGYRRREGSKKDIDRVEADSFVFCKP